MRRTGIASVLGGTAGGALGTAFMQKSMQLSERMPEAIRPPPAREDPGEHMVRRFEVRRGRSLRPTTHRRAARGLHWLYGIGWSGVLGALGPRLGLSRLGRALAAGAVLGAAVWAVGYAGWLPRTGLTRPLRKQGLGASVGGLMGHIGYGVLAALPIYLANRLAARRR